jgi:predicted lactoylglutathione lyase
MTTLAAVEVIVSDLTRSRTFYSLFGLEFPEIAEGEGHIEAVTQSGLRVMLDTEEVIQSFTPDWQKPQGQRVLLAFECTSPEEVDAMYTRVLEAGFASHKAPWDAAWGQRYAQVSDPDGSLVDLFAGL